MTNGRDDVTDIIASTVDESVRVISALKEPTTSAAIRAAATLAVDTIKADGRLISCGNGGSMCDAMHFAEELSGRFRSDRPALPAVAISDPGHLSCVANDYGYDETFARFVRAMGRSGDLLVAISTSGNSANVVRAADTARSLGMRVLALTGRAGSELSRHADVEICTPGVGYADRVQEAHGVVIHLLIELIERSLHPECYA